MPDRAPPLTDAQRELLEDKFILWERQGREYGDTEMRDYHRRAAEAMRAALAICSEVGRDFIRLPPITPP